MKRLPVLLAAVFFAARLHAAEDLATQAVSPDPTVARAAQDKLRAAGPAGLEALTTRFASQIAAHRQGAPADSVWPQIAAALNHVSAQYDDYASGLYWYTDLERAKAASAATGRPILSLRLLGQLDNDLSCANSRFFRTTLYPNANISRLLKERFILHWESVRPVPVVTIDFGDGRQLVRTVTGNSIHYILDSQGRIVDALPGLYSPKSFLTELTKTADAIAAFPNQDSHAIAAYQAAMEKYLRIAWAGDITRVRPGLVVDRPFAINSLITATDSAIWEAIAALPNHQVQLDDNAFRLIGNKAPSAVTAAPLAVSKSGIENPLLRSLRTYQGTTAVDTVRDNYLFRTQILQHLATFGDRLPSLAQLNDWVYTNIFLTPPSDPWFGLAPADAYAALDHDGKTEPKLAADAFSARPLQLRPSTK